MSPKRLLVLALALGFATACRESRLVMTPNRTPTALAQVIGPDGKAARSAQFDYSGQDVEVTLDGSGSDDMDGAIVTYRWLSGNPVPPDGGLGNLSTEKTLPDGSVKVTNAGGRYVPDGEMPNWPDDVAKPTVKLGEGTWTFVLWVIDDRGGVSDPSTVTITIGNPNPLDNPAVKMCADNVYSGVPDSCKTCVCNISDDCRKNVVMSVCDENCWGLIQCIALKCPTFVMDMNISCLTTNCNDFLAKGGTGATAAGGCVAMCASDCGGGGGTPDGGTPDAGH